MLLCTEIETDAPPRNSENARVFFSFIGFPEERALFSILYFIVVIRLSFIYLFIFFYFAPAGVTTAFAGIYFQKPPIRHQVIGA